ncbi:MAG: SusC/RagA family TonB-linked outer membrane protein [Bacteroidales bacterium]
MERKQQKIISPLPGKLKKGRLIAGILAMFFLTLCLNTHADVHAVQQQRTITGTVTDNTGELLPGVSVVVRGTTIGTVTDVDGKYNLTVPPTAQFLTFSFVGMASRDVAIGEQTNIDIVMTSDVIGLDEIVVVGYGTQTRANVIGSVTTVRSDELTAAPVSRVSNALAGRLPGAIVMQTSGEPGYDQANIIIRGNATLGTDDNNRMSRNAPLVVIDGVLGRDLNSLNTDDIESITVLKDASAAIYGARAANGVILVTTKRGAVDAPPTFTYGFSEGFLSPTMLPELTDAPTYARMIREMQSYRGVDPSNMMFSDEDIAKYESGAYPWTHPNTDWYGEALADYSTTRQHNMSVSGGTQSISYFGSFGTAMDDGIYTNSATSYNRYNLRGNIDVRINEYLSVGLDISGSQESRMFPTKSAGAIFSAIVRSKPTDHALYPNGLPGPDIEYGDQPMVASSFETGFDDDKRYRSNNILSANLKIPGIDGLMLSGYYAYDKHFQVRKLFQKPFFLYQLDESAYLSAGNDGSQDGSAFLIGTPKAYPEPRVRDYYNDSDSRTVNVKLDYTKSFDGLHNVSAFAAYEHNEYDAHGIEAFRRHFVTDQLPYLFAGGNDEKDNSGWVNLDARVNYFGRLSYNYNETYLFQFSFRRDGSLRFSEENGRWGNFPSVLVGWRPSEEDWWRNSLGFIDYFKLKASWGQMGNDLVDHFQYLASYAFGRGTIFGSNRAYNLGLYQTGTPNPFITWEVANVFNVGWESMFLNNKMTFDVDLFHERRNNILVRRDASVPQFTGISLPDENFGIVDNRGLEMVLGYNERQGSFRYGFNGNFAFVRNKIVEVDEPERNVPWQVRTGLPQGAHLIYRSIGIFRDEAHVNSLPHVAGARPGDIIIEDYDGDGQITPDDRQLFPLTTTPEITFGFSFNMGYRNWELRGLIQGHGNTLRYIYTDQRQGTAGNYFQYDADGRWTPENTNASKPRAFERGEEYWRGSHITDHHYANASYARLKNLQLSYTLPQSLVSNIRLNNARVYASGQNLWLIYSGNKIMDPELGGMGNYPIMRVISLGAQVTF